MNCLLAGALAILLSAPSDDKKELTAKDLEGTWVGERYTDGKGGKGARGVKVVFRFKGNILEARKASKSLVGGATFKLTDKGKKIDATGSTGAYRRKTYPGIIKVVGDTLTWCTGGTASKSQTRPKKFVASPGKAHYLIILKKQKKP